MECLLHLPETHSGGPVIPVHFQFKDWGITFPSRVEVISAGWWAWPEAPAVGDAVNLTGLLPAIVRSRTWTLREVPKTVSMMDAGLYQPGAPEQWICTIMLEFQEGSR